jgi:hypothetical protein
MAISIISVTDFIRVRCMLDLAARISAGSTWLMVAASAATDAPDLHTSACPRERLNFSLESE